nr:HAD hydrolase family protein [uncultured Clostridium sp.]
MTNLKNDCGKGFAIANICKIINININYVISFGDSPNDVDMIKMCDIGVAMGNDYNEIKEISNFIPKSNDEDGVAHFLKQHLA